MRPSKALTGQVRHAVIDPAKGVVTTVGSKHVRRNYRAACRGAGTRFRQFSNCIRAHHVRRSVVDYPERSAGLDGDDARQGETLR